MEVFYFGSTTLLRVMYIVSISPGTPVRWALMLAVSTGR